MSHTPKLPTVTPEAMINDDVMKVAYIFRRWLKTLRRYGQIGATDRDFLKISRAIKKAKRPIRRAIKRCRDAILSGTTPTETQIEYLQFALDIMCRSHEDPYVKETRQHFMDQGMAERYRPLSKRMAREKIRKIGKTIAFTDAETDDARTTKLIRRFVEKRAAQTAYRYSSRHLIDNNGYRHNMRRAISFSLYNSAFTDYDQQKRHHGTHWKVADGKSGRLLRSKVSYSTFDEATAACQRFIERHPHDTRPLNPYRCEHCGKWHIGHTAATDAQQAS